MNTKRRETAGGEGGKSLQQMVEDIHYAVFGNGQHKGLWGRVLRLEILLAVAGFLLTIAVTLIGVPVVNAHLKGELPERSPEVIVIPADGSPGSVDTERIRALVERELKEGGG